MLTVESLHRRDGGLSCLRHTRQVRIVIGGLICRSHAAWPTAEEKQPNRDASQRKEGPEHT
jgi:hypothetical protein